MNRYICNDLFTNTRLYDFVVSYKQLEWPKCPCCHKVVGPSWMLVWSPIKCDRCSNLILFRLQIVPF